MAKSLSYPPNGAVFILRLTLIMAVLAIWELLAHLKIIDTFFMSRPTDIVIDIIDAFIKGEIIPHIFVTLKEALSGLFIGTVTGVFTAFVLARMETTARILDPIIMAIYGIPKLALGPIFILWFGLGVESKIFLSALMVFFLVFFNSYAGFKNVDQTLVNAVKLMGASNGQIMRKVVLPSSIPWLMAGIKAGLGAALLGAIVGEYIGANAGLGWMVEYAGGMYDIARVFTCIIVLMLLMASLNGALHKVERRLLKWQPINEDSRNRRNDR